MRKELHLIALTNLESETLAIPSIRVMVKLGDITHQLEPKNRSGGKRKARPGKHNLIR